MFSALAWGCLQPGRCLGTKPSASPCSLLLTHTQGVRVIALPGGVPSSKSVRAHPAGLAVGEEGNLLGTTSKHAGFILLKPPDMHILREEAGQQLPGVPALPEGAACLGWAP